MEFQAKVSRKNRSQEFLVEASKPAREFDTFF
jgi:hypothetical protein